MKQPSAMEKVLEEENKKAEEKRTTRLVTNAMIVLARIKICCLQKGLMENRK